MYLAVLMNNTVDWKVEENVTCRYIQVAVLIIYFFVYIFSPQRANLLTLLCKKLERC